MNATWSLPRLVGINRAKELLYSGREVFADEAYHIGLINHLVPNDKLMDKAIEVAAGIAKNRAVGAAIFNADALVRVSMHPDRFLTNLC